MIRFLILSWAFILSVGLHAQEVNQLDLLSQWKDPALVGSTAYNNTYNEVWGLKVGGIEYAVIGSTFGTHILDISDPTNPTEVQRIPGAGQGRSIIHRDYHDFQCYLYAVCDEGPSTLQIIDISNLPDEAPVVYDDNALIRRSHNIFIDSSSARLYSFASRGEVIGYSAMAIFDISNPVEPELIAEHNVFGNINAGHVHDGFVHRDTAYLNCGNAGFAIVDFSDPVNPTTINTLRPNEYPMAGYNHSCWRSTDGTAIYMADENWNADIKVVDISDHNNLDIPMTFDAGNDNPNSIPHNQVVACDRLFVSYYYDGLQVYDISDPLNPQRSHFFPTSSASHRASYEGAWGVYPLLPSGNILVSDMQEGLFILEPLDTDCNTTVSCDIISNTDEILEDWNIRPNPTSGAIEVTLDKGHVVNVFSIDGNNVLRQYLPQGTSVMQLSSLSPGMYFIEAAGKTQKIVKQ
jgi:choice-of-anchor B domain-containing protein